MPLGSRVTLGSRVPLLLCIMRFVLHAREGVPRGYCFPTFKVGKPYMVGTSFVYISPCKTKKWG